MCCSFREESSRSLPPSPFWSLISLSLWLGGWDRTVLGGVVVPKEKYKDGYFRCQCSHNVIVICCPGGYCDVRYPLIEITTVLHSRRIWEWWRLFCAEWDINSEMYRKTIWWLIYWEVPSLSSSSQIMERLRSIRGGIVYRGSTWWMGWYHLLTWTRSGSSRERTLMNNLSI